MQGVRIEVEVVAEVEAVVEAAAGTIIPSLRERKKSGVAGVLGMTGVNPARHKIRMNRQRRRNTNQILDCQANSQKTQTLSGES